MPEPLRAAVIGVGAIGALHARVYARDPRTSLVAVMDVDAGRAEAVGRDLDAAWFTDVGEMLERCDIDLVSVATPERQRHEPAVACARAGTHLLLEKPLGATAEEAAALVADVEGGSGVTMVNFILRSDPRYLRAKAAMTDGTIGEPCTVFARRRGTSMGAEIYAPWTDLLTSTAIHDLDAMVWLNGCEVERVHAEGVVKRSAQWGREDAIAAVLRFRNGAVGMLESSWVLPRTAPAPLDAALHVVGTAGGVFVEGSSYGLAVVDEERYSLPDLAHWPIGRDGVEGALRASISAFIDAVLGGGKPPMSLHEALYAQRVVAALERSMRTGAAVELAPTGLTSD
jgi:predicted dehydrogenase